MHVGAPTGAARTAVGRHEPGDLELDAVGVPPVQALRGAVVAGPGQRAALGQAGLQPLELGEGVDLPGEVVEAHRGASRGRRAGGRTDLEQPEVVVVGRPRGLQERGPREPLRGHVDAAEVEHVGVEATLVARSRT
jgi:hypothetical protein